MSIYRTIGPLVNPSEWFLLSFESFVEEHLSVNGERIGDKYW